MFLQVVSVLLAVALWVQATAVGNPVDRYTFDAVPVVAGEAPSGLVVTGALQPAKVNITVECRRRVAANLGQGSFVASVALAGGHAGTHDYPVEVTAPEGVKIVEISPAAVSVDLEPAAASSVPVRYRLEGAPPEGYTVGTASVSPVTVTVRGPSSLISRVVLALATVDLSSLTSEAKLETHLVPVDASGLEVTGVSLSPAAATVAVPIVALPSPESVDIDPILTGSPGEGFAVLRVSCVPARASVRAKPGLAVDFDRVTTLPVDISGSTSDVTAIVRLVTPDTVADIEPAEVEVVVEIGAVKTFADIPVSVRNVSRDYTQSLRPETVTIVLRGPKSLLDRLQAAEIVAYVDATGVTAGTTSVEVFVEFPAWTAGQVEVSSISPARVELTLYR